MNVGPRIIALTLVYLVILNLYSTSVVSFVDVQGTSVYTCMCAIVSNFHFYTFIHITLLISHSNRIMDKMGPP